MGQIYNPNDFLCQVCAYKTCLLENKGRELIRKKIRDIEKHKKDKRKRT
ncbi:MAG: hypothetical protein GXO22_01930 [Aquificae bacterium]|nr:hypothetical protein [Aquificota bacterium]